MTIQPQYTLTEAHFVIADLKKALEFYADPLAYERFEARPREYHSMYDTRDEPSEAENDGGATARAALESVKP